MLKLKLSDIAIWTRGHLYGADTWARSVSIDSRYLELGALFIAIRGQHVDGHDFLEDAARHGAVGALVSRPCKHPLPQVLVEDVVTALGDLASAVRAQYPVQVLGITGSSGKTTVKTLITAILSRYAPTHASSGNYNNEIGLPLSLLSAPDEVRYMVLEMGAGKPGDISYLAGIARPQIALVNNVSAAHLERLETLDGVAETKGAIYDALPVNGIAVINADDAYARAFANRAAPRKILRFGLAAAAAVRAENIAADLQGSSFQLLTPAGSVPVNLHLPGPHNLMNALAATALALAVEISLPEIVIGL
ncbi:MAG TPA: UDP-N-acetylmuramoyl-tripeptide--D-alanyl-D-alanine ligase, partial [Mizugakiibacter sp.]|nr:UDP-N-acetylmuramoyl-tripeptide--D-alanyl-D-alanine ligase [Mizugakiibacter sp.]